jgi:EAL domain-containing protein (putative c-di-GMP-specific phosphodiesterase class I)
MAAHPHCRPVPDDLAGPQQDGPPNEQQKITICDQPIAFRAYSSMPIPLEARRIRSAQHYLIDGPLAGRLETLLSLASQAVDFPIVRVNIVDEDTQHTIRLFGAGDPTAVARSDAFCDTVVRTGRPVLVEDASTDPRFADFPAVLGGHVGSYLGVPLIGRESMVIGSICVIDPKRRVISPDQMTRLIEFGKVVEDQLDLIRRLQEQRLEGDVATAEVARAVRGGEIVPWYQPVVDLATGETRGFEALARWEHPVRGVDDPRRFVPVAEDSDLIIELDLAVIRRAATDLRRWQLTNPSLRVSVNLSANHLDNPGSANILNQIVTDAGIAPRSIDFELTETTRIDVGDAKIPRAVHELRRLGFQVWLDDFGTGWSSLDQLLWLPVDGIKIDRAVAVALGTPVGDALTLAVTGLAAALGLRTTIEGIESQTNANLARKLGCDYGQGYLWDRPKPAAAINQTLSLPPVPPEGGHPGPFAANPPDHLLS